MYLGKTAIFNAEFEVCVLITGLLRPKYLINTAKKKRQGAVPYNTMCFLVLLWLNDKMYKHVLARQRHNILIHEMINFL